MAAEETVTLTGPIEGGTACRAGPRGAAPGRVGAPRAGERGRRPVLWRGGVSGLRTGWCGCLRRALVPGPSEGQADSGLPVEPGEEEGCGLRVGWFASENHTHR